VFKVERNIKCAPMVLRFVSGSLKPAVGFRAWILVIVSGAKIPVSSKRPLTTKPSEGLSNQ